MLRVDVNAELSSPVVADKKSDLEDSPAEEAANGEEDAGDSEEKEDEADKSDEVM